MNRNFISLTNKSSIQTLLKHGKRGNHNIYYSIRYLFSNEKKSHYLLVVKKKIFKLAVTRNKIKRQIRLLLNKNTFDQSCDLLIEPKIDYLKTNFKKIGEEFKKTLNFIYHQRKVTNQ
jgi:ribonuclease P protein component